MKDSALALSVCNASVSGRERAAPDRAALPALNEADEDEDIRSPMTAMERLGCLQEPCGAGLLGRVGVALSSECAAPVSWSLKSPNVCRSRAGAIDQAEQGRAAMWKEEAEPSWQCEPGRKSSTPPTSGDPL